METQGQQHSLGELANMALGSSKLTKEHLSILQVLVMALLKKLSCENEIVRISGFDGQCLMELLNRSHDTPAHVNLHKSENFREKFMALNKLELRAKQISVKMDGHFEEIRKHHDSPAFKPEFWHMYAAPTEDLCRCFEENLILCDISSHPTLNKEMRRRATEPIVKRIVEFELKIDKMLAKLKALNAVADELLPKIKLIEPFIMEVQKHRHIVDKHWQRCRTTLAEVEQMLSCKLDRIALPALKIYISERFTVVHDHLRFLGRKSTKCSKYKLFENAQNASCLSCYSKRDVHPVKLLHLKLDGGCDCGMTSRRRNLLNEFDKIRVKSFRVVDASTPHDLQSSRLKKAHAIAMLFRGHGHYAQSYTFGQQRLHKGPRAFDSFISVVQRHKPPPGAKAPGLLFGTPTVEPGGASIHSSRSGSKTTIASSKSRLTGVTSKVFLEHIPSKSTPSADPKLDKRVKVVDIQDLKNIEQFWTDF